MKLIDLSQGGKKQINSKYMVAPQPMPIYHSEEELDTSERNPVKLRGFADYYYYAEKNNIIGQSYITVKDNLFVKTTDKFLPDYTDTSEDIHLVLDDNKKPIPVESCWVRIYVIYGMEHKHLLYTSSGIWSVSIKSWRISAGPKTQYSAVTRKNKSRASKNGTKHYQEYINKLINKKIPDKRSVRLAHLIFNPLSPYFFSPDKAIKKVYPNDYIRKEDYSRFLNSTQFRRTFMSELGLILPTLTKSIRDAIKEEDLAAYIKKIIAKSVDKETSEEAMSRIKDVIHLAYEDPTGKIKAKEVPLIQDAKFTEDKQLEEYANDQLEQVKKDLNYPDSYIMEDLPENLENVIPSKDEED